MDTSDTISAAEAARMLRAEPHFVYALILRGALLAVGPGPEIKVSRTAVQKYANAHPQKGSLSIRDEKESIVWH